MAVAEALFADAQFFVTSFDGVSVFTTVDDVSRPDTKDASAVQLKTNIAFSAPLLRNQTFSVYEINLSLSICS